MCEVMDSYGLPLDRYPIKDWVTKHWKYVVTNGRSLQGLHSQACGHYVLLYLKLKAQGGTLQDFLNYFSPYDRVKNDHEVGKILKKLIQSTVNDLPVGGQQTCKTRA